VSPYIRSRLQQAPDSHCERKHTEKVNPPMRYCESAPDADQADGDDRRKTNILTCQNASRRNPLGKEQSQEEEVINIGGGEGRHARRQHRQIFIHEDSSFPFTPGRRNEAFSKSAQVALILFRPAVQRSRALLTDSRNLRASSPMRSGCRRRMASLGINSPPTPSAIAPAAMKLNAVR
jgi:hypothetical protein